MHHLIRYAAGFVLLLVLSASHAAAAQSQGDIDLSKRDMDKEALIWKQIEKVAPKAVDDFKAGTQALDNDRFQEAVAFYRRVYKLAPKDEAVNRRLGTSLALSGQVQEAMQFLVAAVNTKRSAAGSA